MRNEKKALALRPDFGFLLLLFILTGTAFAADPQAYRVDLASTGNSERDATLKATSDLIALRSTAPVSAFGLIARARSDVDRLKTVLESFGYYQSAVAIKINGLALSDPGLGELLSGLPKGTDAKVTATFILGPLYQLRRIGIDGDVADPAQVLKVLNLSAGQPAVAETVLAGGARLLTSLQEQGYAFAKVDPPIAYEAADAPVLDLTFHIVTGQRVNIGEIHFDGLKRVHESLVRARLLLRTGEPYRPSRIEKARHDLLALGVFSQVSVQIGTAIDSSGGAPVTFQLRERNRHAVSVNAGYSSDLGGSSGFTWTDRNVFGNAEQLSFAASVINLGGSDSTGVGYDTSVKFLKPDFLRRDQSLQFTVTALKQSLQAYDQKSLSAGVNLVRKLSSIWTASIGFVATEEQIIQESVLFNYTLLAAPVVFGYDTTNLSSPLDDPRHGFRGSLSITPTLAIGHPNATFVLTQLKMATYFDLHELLPVDPGRSVIAARGLAGVAQGASEYSLPPDQRFYGGGSDTIRGYRFQSVGPAFPKDGLPIGGTAIEAGSIELRQRFGGNFGAAFFVDAGQVSASLRAVSDEFRVGVGAGLRYYTPIGPIRLDVAVPTNQRQGDDSFEVYVGLGQAF